MQAYVFRYRLSPGTSRYALVRAWVRVCVNIHRRIRPYDVGQGNM
jgi:hypothetical protein